MQLRMRMRLSQRYVDDCHHTSEDIHQQALHAGVHAVISQRPECCCGLRHSFQQLGSDRCYNQAFKALDHVVRWHMLKGLGCETKFRLVLLHVTVTHPCPMTSFGQTLTGRLRSSMFPTPVFACLCYCPEAAQWFSCTPYSDLIGSRWGPKQSFPQYDLSWRYISPLASHRSVQGLHEPCTCSSG